VCRDSSPKPGTSSADEALPADEMTISRTKSEKVRAQRSVGLSTCPSDAFHGTRMVMGFVAGRHFVGDNAWERQRISFRSKRLAAHDRVVEPDHEDLIFKFNISCGGMDK